MCLPLTEQAVEAARVDDLEVVAVDLGEVAVDSLRFQYHSFSVIWTMWVNLVHLVMSSVEAGH